MSSTGSAGARAAAGPCTEGTGLSAWGKSGNIAGRPGYVKMGAGRAAASLYTPELTALPDAATVKVRFSAQAYSEKYDGSGADAGKILVKAVRGAVLGARGAITGTVTEVLRPTLWIFRLPKPGSASSRQPSRT